MYRETIATRATGKKRKASSMVSSSTVLSNPFSPSLCSTPTECKK